MKTIEKTYKSKGYTGLSRKEVAESLSRYGRNIMSKKRKKSFLSHFLSNLNDPVIRILLVALGVNSVFVFFGGDLIETVGIGISVFLATLISTLSERGGQAAFDRLSERWGKEEARVIREGRVELVSAEDVVVGDLVLLGAGEGIPADGYIIDGKISVDQSAMTGESREVEKSPSSSRQQSPNEGNTALRGCSVLSGEGIAEIFAVGEATFLGQISREVQTDTRDSPLKVRLTRLASQISRLGYVASAVVALAYLFNNFVISSGFRGELILMKLSDPVYLFGTLLHAFMLGLTVIVVAVPEGLPMMIAVVLSANIKRMIKDNVLVRKPVGIEAAGSMNILFTDKTGTLTEGRMSVSEVITAVGEYSCLDDFEREDRDGYMTYAYSCLYNSEAVLSGSDVIGGNATDRALVGSVAGREHLPRAELIRRIPFDSDRKYSAAELSGKYRGVLIKGAAEALLPHVSYAKNKGGRDAFSPYSYDVARRISAHTTRGERVLIIAEARNMPTGRRMPELTFACAVVLKDRVRPEARGAVDALQGAGIRVVMITGDARETAESIAKETGIYKGEYNRIITGEELAGLSDSEVKALLPTLSAVARALPSDKSRLVRLSQEEELVVGMTGDGINDAPALKLSDVGFAMGNGTHVAKEAGDIIILDSNLSSVARAVLYGRNIFKSIRKFITLQLTMNFCAVGVSMIGPFVGVAAPVTVVQMLWINIIMDTLGGLAFAGESALPSCMSERPKRRDEPILNRYMTDQIILLGAYTIALCIAFLLSPTIGAHFRPAEDRLCLLTAFFALFIFTSVFNCFGARTDRLKFFTGLVKNPAFIFIMLAIGVVQIAFIYLGGDLLRTMPLTVSELLYTFLLAATVLPFELFRKLLWRFRGKKEGF